MSLPPMPVGAKPKCFSVAVMKVRERLHFGLGFSSFALTLVTVINRFYARRWDREQVTLLRSFLRCGNGCPKFCPLPNLNWLRLGFAFLTVWFASSNPDRPD